jgi:tetratricopeptide (TPR) repeat protein
MKETIGKTLVLFMFCSSVCSAQDVDDVSLKNPFKERFDAGEYWYVGSEGLLYLKAHPDNHELRMQVADSLSWTGRYPEAVVEYQILSGTGLADRAAVGLANLYRWSGRPDLAIALYRQVLKTQPDNPDALDGLRRVDRELRSGTEVVVGKKSDSNSVVDHSTEFKQRWRGDDLALKYELSLNSNRYALEPLNARQQEVSLSIDHAGMNMAPKLNLSVQQGPVTKGFASLRLKLSEVPELHMTIGHVNWGNMAYHPLALLGGLTASQLGADGSLLTRAGTISVLYNAYQISDGNQIQDANVHFSPSWRPLGPDFRYFVGLSGHQALRNVPIYWSPQTGYLSADIGFTHEWSLTGGEYSIYGQRGFGVGGEALNSYNMGFAAKHYVGKDWAATISSGLLRNQRVNAYRSKYLSVGTERLW